LERLIVAILRRPALSLVSTLVVTAVLALGLSRLELRTDGAAIYPEDNAVVQQTELDRDAFYDPQQVITLISSRPEGPLVASPEGFRFVKQIHRSLARMPGVYGDGVHSLASLLDVRSNLETMIITTHLDSIPDDSLAFSELLARLRQVPLTDGLYLSVDGRMAAVYVPLAESIDRQVILAALDRWFQTRRDASFEMRLMGPVVAEATLGTMVLRDLAVLIPVMVAVVALMLLATLRTIGGFLIPLMEALLVLVWTLGLMGWVGAPVTLVTTILPVILMTMAITDEIHLLQRLQAHLAGNGTQPPPNLTGRDRLREATVSALRDVGRPIIVTSITTSIGFLSFLTASMLPMRHFGLFTAFGIVMAMVLSFTFIPCLIVLLPVTWFQRTARRKRQPEQPRLVWVERFTAHRTGVAFVVGLAIVVVSVPGLMWLEVQDSWVDNFDKRSTLVSAENEFNDGFWGSYRLDVVFEGAPGLFYQSRGVALMEEFTASAAGGPHVGGVASYLDVFEEVAKGLGESGRLSSLDNGKLQDIATVAEMAADQKALLQLMDQDGAAARATIFVNSPNYKRSEHLSDYVDQVRRSIEENYGVKSHVSGDIPVALEVVRSIVVNQMRSISWTLLGIALLLMLIFPQKLAALVAMIPVTTTAIIVLSIMGYTGMPLGIATSMFASLTIGVGVDFALHFLHNYRRERQTGKDHQPALVSTLENTGQAIRWNATVLVLGFMALTFSNLRPDRDLGILLAMAMVTCYGMTLLFLPRLLRRLALVMVLFVAALPTGAIAGERGETAPDDPSAWTLVHRLESDFRWGARVVKIQFSTTYARKIKKPIQRTMWGVINGDTSDTRIMYVVTEPPRMLGTTLLFADKADTTAPDSTWLYLSAVKRVSLLDIRSARAMVPGTALTYEDSRGFVPVDKYRFRFSEDSTEVGINEAVVIAEPLSEEIRAGVGFDAMVLRIDLEKQFLKQIDYLDDRREVFKTYRLEESIKLGEVWFPARVTVRNDLNSAVSTAWYTYWPLAEAPPGDVFDPDIKAGLFLDRLNEVMHQVGIDSQSAGGAAKQTGH